MRHGRRYGSLALSPYGGARRDTSLVLEAMEEDTETLTTAQMAERAGVTQRTVQRWLKREELHATALRGGQYVINQLDLVELSLPLRGDTTPKEKRLSHPDAGYVKAIMIRAHLMWG